MNGVGWSLTLGLAVGCVYLVWRIFTLVRIREKDQRRFFAFWLWLPVWFLLENLTPSWATPDRLFAMLEAVFALGAALDFFYYFCLRTPRVRRQIISGLCFLPCLLFIFRDRLLPGPRVALAPPHYGKALVWTDRALLPRTFYFIDPETKQNSPHAAPFEDPNYGKAVFAPMDGRVSGFDEGGFIRLEGGGRWRGVGLTLGPLLSGSERIGVGDEVRQYQPLGLAGSAGGIPGIRLRVESGGKATFQDCYAGRWLAPRYRFAYPKRNHQLQSDAAKRFRVGL